MFLIIFAVAVIAISSSALKERRNTHGVLQHLGDIKLEVRRRSVLKDNFEEKFSSIFNDFAIKDPKLSLSTLQPLYDILSPLPGLFDKFQKSLRPEYESTLHGKQVSAPGSEGEALQDISQTSDSPLTMNDVQVICCYNDIVRFYNFIIDLRSGAFFTSFDFILFYRGLHSTNGNDESITPASVSALLLSTILIRRHISEILSTEGFHECSPILDKYVSMESAKISKLILPLLETLKFLDVLLQERSEMIQKFQTSGDKNVIVYNDLLDDFLMASKVPFRLFPIFPDYNSLSTIGANANEFTDVKIALFTKQTALLSTLLPFEDIRRFISPISFDDAVRKTLDSAVTSTLLSTSVSNLLHLCILIPYFRDFSIVMQNFALLAQNRKFIYIDLTQVFKVTVTYISLMKQPLISLLNFWWKSSENPNDVSVKKEETELLRLISSTLVALDKILLPSAEPAKEWFKMLFQEIQSYNTNGRGIPYLLSTTALLILTFESHVVMSSKYDGISFSDLDTEIASGLLADKVNDQNKAMLYKPHLLDDMGIRIADIMKTWKQLLYTQSSWSSDDKAIIRDLLINIEGYSGIVPQGKSNAITSWRHMRSILSNHGPTVDVRGNAFQYIFPYSFRDNFASSIFHDDETFVEDVTLVDNRRAYLLYSNSIISLRFMRHFKRWNTFIMTMTEHSRVKSVETSFDVVASYISELFKDKFNELLLPVQQMDVDEVKSALYNDQLIALFNFPEKFSQAFPSKRDFFGKLKGDSEPVENILTRSVFALSLNPTRTDLSQSAIEFFQNIYSLFGFEEELSQNVFRSDYFITKMDELLSKKSSVKVNLDLVRGLKSSAYNLKMNGLKGVTNAARVLFYDLVRLIHCPDGFTFSTITVEPQSAVLLVIDAIEKSVNTYIKETKAIPGTMTRTTPKPPLFGILSTKINRHVESAQRLLKAIGVLKTEQGVTVRNIAEVLYRVSVLFQTPETI